MKPYQPSQIVPAGGALLLLLVILVGGFAIGALASFLANVLYIILVFPFLMGAIGGEFSLLSIRYGKIRNPSVALVGGLLMGLVIVVSFWLVSYLQFTNNGAAFANSAQPDFFKYIQVMAQKGVPVIHIGNVDLLNLGPVFSWIYWAFEIILIVWLSSRPGKTQAREPFCETCNHWYPKPALLGTLGSSRQKEVLNLIESGQLQKLGEELQSNPALPNVGVFLATCGADCVDGDSYLAVNRQVRSSRGGVGATGLASGLISPPQLQDLQRGIEARRALYGLEPPAPTK
jgi:hypothetical protein